MNLRIKQLILAISAFFIAGSAMAQDSGSAPQMPDNPEVLLPAEQLGYHVDELTLESHPKRGEWLEFMKNNGVWTIDFDEATGTPHRAVGKAIKIEGYDRITEENIEAASMRFLRKYASLMGIETENLKLVRKTHVNRRWYVTYRQMYRGVEVLHSEIELRIFENGNVMAFGADYYDDIDVPVVATISESEAIASAIDGINYNPKSDKTLAAGKKFILPVKKGYSVDYKLVYEVNVNQPRKMQRWSAYVDARSGKLVRRRNEIPRATETLTATGGVKPVYSFDQEESLPFRHMTVKVNGQEYTTDENGMVDVDLNGSATVTAGMNGLYANVSTDEENADYSNTFASGEEINLVWDDENSHRFERYLYYYTNYVHDYAKTIDPDMTCMDFPMDVKIEFNGQSPNAGSQGRTIRFMAVSNPDYVFAETPSILYHEYGHSINMLLYQDLGAPTQLGMENLTCQEATADIFSALIIDSHLIGEGAFATDSTKVIRNLKNDMIYPDSLAADSHHNGLILGGAYWDLYEMTGDLEYARHLTHFVKYGMPDDINIGVAFKEFFLETLIADDDDGDLSNGTPHSEEIITCFNRHKIGFNLFYLLSLAHQELDDTRDTENPYPVVFTLSETAGIGDSKVEDVAVMYTLDNGETLNRVEAERTGENEFTAYIPPQPRGTMVKYYMVGTESVSGHDLEFVENVRNPIPYVFLVGYNELYVQDFDEHLGYWEFDFQGGGMFSAGEFEVAEPQLVDLSQFGLGEIIQPGEDHSADGTKCLVTDGKTAPGTGFIQHALIAGATTATSESMDMSLYNTVVLKYYSYTMAMALNANVSQPIYTLAQVSGDGENWITVDSIPGGGGSWMLRMVPIPEQALTADFRLRFYAVNKNVSGMGGMVIAEALIDDIKLMTASPINSVEENYGNREISIFPNPAEGDATISFDIDNPGAGSVRIYDMLGNEVVSIYEGWLGAGEKRFHWHAIDKNGEKVSPGVYYVKLFSGNRVITDKIIVR
ncbi:MAG: T9SS type A sorting domain-containing protein [Candidatus Kapaibacterium sp.]